MGKCEGIVTEGTSIKFINSEAVFYIGKVLESKGEVSDAEVVGCSENRNGNGVFVVQNIR